MKKLMIFDLDGTLFNTDEVNYRAYCRALEEEGFVLNHDEFVSEFNGKSYKYFLPIITSNASNEIIERIHDKKKIYYKENLEYAKINEHLFSIIENNRDSYYMVIVTTASKKNCHEILRYFNKFENFDMIITANDYKKTKPDPEGFLLAMNKFNKESKHTIIFEDSDVGIKAAKATNATVLKIEKF